jgi:hypothetical protein
LNHQANGSASQYLTVAHQYPSPQHFADNISRQNSYDERDDHHHQRGQWANSSETQPGQYDAYDMQVKMGLSFLFDEEKNSLDGRFGPFVSK